jgi:uncharacterized protein YjbI with pentapeptide repeats
MKKTLLFFTLFLPNLLTLQPTLFGMTHAAESNLTKIARSIPFIARTQAIRSLPPRFKPVLQMNAQTMVESNNGEGLDLRCLDFKAEKQSLNEHSLLKSVNLQAALLYEANFSGVNMQHANLSNAILYKAHFSGADLSRAQLSHTSLLSAQLEKINATQANCTGANFAWANCTEANFVDANLENATFQQTNLKDANLFGANLNGTVFENVDLSTTTGLTKSQLKKAILHGNTLLPPHLSHLYQQTTEETSSRKSFVNLFKKVYDFYSHRRKNTKSLSLSIPIK